jgi:hypothetical protein
MNNECEDCTPLLRELSRWPDGTKLRVDGVIIARQRPATARGTAFIALEDEGGVANVILRPEVFTAYREVLRGRFAVIEGTLQWQGRVCGVVGQDHYSTSGGDGAVDNLDVFAIGRYVRVHATERGTEWGNSLWELEVFASLF